MKQKKNIAPIQDEIVLYQSEDGNVNVDVLFQDETVWLTQEQMAQLFGKGRTTIIEHIGNIFKEGELNAEWYVGISDIPLSMVLSKGFFKPKK